MTGLKSFLRKASVDRAVGYAMAMRAWQVPSGVVTTALIALYFDQETQGVYYMLLSLMGLQALADSGLLNVLMHVVSHEWSRLRLDQNGFLRGPRTARCRVSAILRFGLIWFLIAASGLIVFGIAFGATLFRQQGIGSLATYPLVIALLLAGCILALSPMIALLEGCNQVTRVNRCRLMQAIVGSIVVWVCLVGGANLWTPVFAVAIQLGWELYIIFGCYRRFFVQLWRTRPELFDWKVEVWPLQWRIGLQSAVRYLAFFPLIPTLFAWQGAVVAGQAGMTWSVLNNLLLVSYAWIRTRAPEFGRLIAMRQRLASTQALFKATIGSTLLLIVATTCFWTALLILDIGSFGIASRIAERFLSPQDTLWFALAIIPLHLTQCFAIHLRSQKFDPIWRITVVGNTILGTAIFLAASQLGAYAVGIAMLVVFSIVMPLVIAAWLKYERYFAQQTA